jgi:hypothetical protein
MPKMKINKEKLKELCQEGATVDEVCEAFDVSCSAARQAMRNLGLKPISKSQAKLRDRTKMSAPPPAANNVISSPRWNDEMDCQLMATDGRYDSLNKLAEVWGKTIRQVTARYHQVRV